MRRMPQACMASIRSAEVSASGEPSSTPGTTWQWMSVWKGSSAGADVFFLKKENIADNYILRRLRKALRMNGQGSRSATGEEARRVSSPAMAWSMWG